MTQPNPGLDDSTIDNEGEKPMKPNTITVPVLRPFTRAPIKPAVRHVDRKKDYRRKPKHQGGEQ